LTEGKLFTATAGTARLWDLRTGENKLLPQPESGTFQAVFSPTGDSVAATLDNGAVQVWCFLPEDRIVTFLLKGHRNIAFSIDFSRDGQLIATGSTDGTARVWQLRGVLAPKIEMVSTPPNQQSAGEPGRSAQRSRQGRSGAIRAAEPEAARVAGLRFRSGRRGRHHTGWPS
jgi:hypothetical protein